MIIMTAASQHTRFMAHIAGASSQSDEIFSQTPGNTTMYARSGGPRGTHPEDILNPLADRMAEPMQPRLRLLHVHQRGPLRAARIVQFARPERSGTPRRAALP